MRENSRLRFNTHDGCHSSVFQEYICLYTVASVLTFSHSHRSIPLHSTISVCFYVKIEEGLWHGVSKGEVVLFKMIIRVNLKAMEEWDWETTMMAERRWDENRYKYKETCLFLRAIFLLLLFLSTRKSYIHFFFNSRGSWWTWEWELFLIKWMSLRYIYKGEDCRRQHTNTIISRSKKKIRNFYFLLFLFWLMKGNAYCCFVIGVRKCPEEKLIRFCGYSKRGYAGKKRRRW